MTRAVRLLIVVLALAATTYIGSAGHPVGGPAVHAGHAWADMTWPPPPVAPVR